MGRIKVLDPTAPPPEDDLGPGPDAGELAGKVVGIRYDRAWRAFEWVTDEWAKSLRDAGAEVRVGCAGSRIGEAGDRTRLQLEESGDSGCLAVGGLGDGVYC